VSAAAVIEADPTREAAPLTRPARSRATVFSSLGSSSPVALTIRCTLSSGLQLAPARLRLILSLLQPVGAPPRKAMAPRTK
jgi:hypothetical protein